MRTPATSNITRTIPPSDATLQELSQTKACEHCDSGKEIGRPQRRSTDPIVHYGLIASGNSVVKDGVSRDNIVQRLGDKCICFEMEAAGLMDNFPCLVIRGICDYADTHKNDRWQNYSAATAAALAKELLEVIDGDDVEGASRVDEIMEKLCEDVSQIRSTTKDMQQDLHFQDVMKWLSPPDPSTNDNKALQQRHEGTGQWFLDSQEYSNWKTTQKSSLWLHGIPGCGKTILSSIVVQDLRSTEPYARSLLFFYFDFTDTSKQSLEKAIRSLIAQLYCNSQNVQAPLNSLYSSCKSPSRQPNFNELRKAFKDIIQQIGEVWIVLDALDECQTRRVSGDEGLLLWIKSILHSPRLNVHFLVISRPEHDIKSVLERFVDDQIILQSDLVTEDIRAYVHGTVRNYEGFKRWRSHESIQNEIESHLMEKANGMFRWVSCQLEALEKCPDPLSLRQTLQSLPRTLDETYARVLNRIPPEFEQNAMRILQFLVFSERPLRVEEAVDVIAVVIRNKPRFDAKDRMPQADEISIYCSSLVAVVTRGEDGDNRVKELQLAHFSVKEYLLSDRLQQNISRTFVVAQARASITEICLTYLLDLDHSLSLVSVRQSYPLAQYAARYWISHAIQAETGRVHDLIREFCLDEESPQISYRLYNPDTPWETKPESSQTDEIVVLYYVACGGIVSAVEDVLKNGADVNAQGGRYGNALQAASERGHQEIIQMLLNNGADVNAQAALERGHQEIIQMLLNNGADVNAQDSSGQTSLSWAARNGREAVVKMLIDT
ncbi:pfs domain-containing protein [Colletotrichum kahawae]|uniref:Pfs domain-containing protein n=1 Tax=Colletotrichum kahawae TaxID=34407 RepID=A0AAE0D6N8_COLKA|nr:pfs domain-containing protein [Colletotrichum kahawae]